MCGGTLRPAAGAEISTVVAVAGLSANWTASKRLFTAVLAATGCNLLNYGSSAVASGISYSCRPALQEFEVRGGRHSIGRHWVSVDFAEIVGRCYYPRYHLIRSGFERAHAHTPVLQSVL